jgi:Acetoacetate decarboxylase (ADC)
MIRGGVLRQEAGLELSPLVGVRIDEVCVRPAARGGHLLELLIELFADLTVTPMVGILSYVLGQLEPPSSDLNGPDFIERCGDPEIPPPYSFPGIRLTSFRLDADLIALQALCDRFLNIGNLSARGFEYRAIIPYVDMEILIYPRMETPFFKNYMSQREIYFRFFVLKFQLVGAMLLPTVELACFFPFIFVDNPWSAIAGREVVGYPKELARFHLPKEGPYPIKVDTQVIRQFGNGTPVSWETFVTINAAKSGVNAAKSGAKQLPPMRWPWGELKGFDPVLRPTLEKSAELQPGICSTIHLKQFRDAERATKACYQALVQGSFDITRLGKVELMPPAEVVIASYESLPIIRLLGLKGTALSPVWQYRMECDMKFGDTRDLYVVTG